MIPYRSALCSRLWKELGVDVDVEDHTACMVSCDGFRVRGCIIEQLSDCFSSLFCDVIFFCGGSVQVHYHGGIN